MKVVRILGSVSYSVLRFFADLGCWFCLLFVLLVVIVAPNNWPFGSKE